ncbi:MAG: ABC transporter permease [Tetrasphaera sp.]|nr:ABC transporter permease [Tetrasphaera sp.]
MLALGLARFVILRNVTSFRRGWPVFLSGFFEPVFYLFSIGVGLGALVKTVTTDSGAVVGYADFVAPAMLASAAMNGAIMDVTFNVFHKLRFAKLYDTMLATPAAPKDIAVGEVTWALIRGGIYSAGFLVVALGMGFVHSWWAVLALPAALVIGAAFAGVGMWATTYMTTWQQFEIIFLIVQPMFLFSATFFPLSSYPEALQWVVRATPLYHGVVLERGLMLGDVGSGLVGSLAYLLVLGGVGMWGAGRRIERLLLT